MDEDRWPDAIRKAVDDVTCPMCGTPKRDGVLVTVRYQAPIWSIVANCFKCRTVHLWQHIDLAGILQPKPKPEVLREEVPLPDWVKNLK